MAALPALRPSCHAPPPDTVTGPYFTASEYTAAGCKVDSLYGTDVAATLGGGTLSFDFAATLEVGADGWVPWAGA
jgi:hypothetical protein